MKNIIKINLKKCTKRNKKKVTEITLIFYPGFVKALFFCIIQGYSGNILVVRLIN